MTSGLIAVPGATCGHAILKTSNAASATSPGPKASATHGRRALTCLADQTENQQRATTYYPPGQNLGRGGRRAGRQIQGGGNALDNVRSAGMDRPKSQSRPAKDLPP